MKRILITGGAGFIGSHLCESLLDNKYPVICVDNLNNYYKATIKKANIGKLKLNKNFHFYKADVRQKSSLNQIFKKHQVAKVIHLAAEVGVRPSFARISDYIDTNVLGTQNVLDCALENKVKQIIFASSSSVYGKRKGLKGFTESDPVKPISPYALTKVNGEHLCRINAVKNKIATTVLRFFTVYGPRNRPDMATYQFTESILKGKVIKLFGKRTKRDFTYVADIVAGLMLALNKPYSYKVINLGNSTPITIFSLIRLIEGLLPQKARVNITTLPAGDVPNTFANIKRAKQALGWQPTTVVKDGLKKFMWWYKNMNKL